MDIYEVIRQRRTIKNFTADAIPRERLEQALEAGIWAQNHGLTQPWRFTILGPETREMLALLHPAFREKIMKPTEMVVVTQVLSADDNVRREDYAAVSCAIQNIALAAWADGIGSIWSTGKWTRLPETATALGIDSSREEVIAFLNFGFPDGIANPPARKPLADVLRELP
jgi:nitroreductase